MQKHIKSKVENGEVIEDYKSAFIVSDEAQTHLSYPCYVSAFQDECFQDFITNALNQQRVQTVREILNKWNELRPKTQIGIADFYEFLTKLEK